jgi:hypothetical protein
MEDERPRDAYGELAKPVHIIDISIPFWSLVGLLVQIALASIPAVIILAIIWSLTRGAWVWLMYAVEQARRATQ